MNLYLGHIILLLAFLLLNIKGLTQEEIDILSIKQSYSPYLNNNKTPDVQILESDIILILPINIIDSSYYIIPSFDMVYVDYKSKQNKPKLDMIGVDISLALYKDWKKHWSTLVQAGIGNYKSYKHKGNRHLEYFANIIMSKKINDNLSTGVGLYYANDVSASYVMPIIEFSWTINKYWGVEGVLPESFDIYYNINTKLSIGYEFGSYGNIFTGNEPGVEYIYESTSDFPWSYYENLLYFEMYLTENAVFNISAGADINRKLDFYDSNDQLIKDPGYVNGSFGLKPFVSFGFYFRVEG